MAIHWDDLWERFKEVMAEFRGQTIGMVGLGIIITMVLLGIFAPLIAPNTNGEWSNTGRWEDNPRYAAPVWVDYILPGSRARHKVDHDIQLADNRTVGTSIYINEYSLDYNMDYDYPPQDIYIDLEGDIENPSEQNTQSFMVDFQRPDNRTLSRLIDDQLSSATAEQFERRYYFGRSIPIRNQVYNWARPYAEGKSGVVVNSLRVSPSLITPGNGVSIVAKVTNLATEPGSVSLSIDGEEINSYNVGGEESTLLSPGAKYPELFHTFEETGQHQIKLGDQTWTVSVVPQEQIVTDLKVTNLEKNYYANVGEKVTITFDANNTGDSEIQDSVYVSGKAVKNFTVPAGGKVENITATIKTSRRGTLPVRIGDQNANIFVYVAGLPTPQDINPVEVLFSKANDNIFSDDPDPLKGDYQLQLTTVGDQVELRKSSRVIFAGQVYGLMGTDNMGHDIALGWIWGARYALIIGASIALLTVVIGTVYGMTSAYFGGWVDEVMQRANEIVLGINSFIVVILIMYLWKKSIWVFVAVYGGLSWRGIAKIIRSRGLQIRQDTYIEAAESLGSSGGRIIRKHMIPQILPYSVAEAALMVPLFVMTEAGLSVLGLGDPEIVTWGRLLSEAREFAMAGGYWWWVLLPGLGLVLLGFAFISSGMAIEKVVNPKMRQR